jgi:hypothetical protein
MKPNKQLNQQVKRNLKRFPVNFAFRDVVTNVTTAAR